MNHEDTAAELHATLQQGNGSMGDRNLADMAGADLPIVEKEKGGLTAGDAELQPTPDDQEPSEVEKQTLRHIGDKFPKSAYLVAVVELCERFTYYGCQGLFQNYINNHPDADSFKAIGMMIANRNTNAAKPSWRAANGKTKAVPWNDHFVEELKRALRACKVFTFYPVFWVCYGQFSSNFVSQAGQMEGHGMPNDLMQNFDPISIIVFIPILDRVVYPALRRYHIELKPIARITIGFSLASLCLAYAAIVQHIIYSSGPCYGNPGGCPAGMDGNKKLPNNVHIAVQTPAYMFIGVAEIFISVTGLEYAYTKAPSSMKSFVQSLYLFTNAIGSALSEALVPATGDPAIMYMYTGVSIAAALTAVIFWYTFHHYDREEEAMNELGARDDVYSGKGEDESETRSQDGRAQEPKEKT